MKRYIQFERMVRYYGLKPITKVLEPDGTEILIADGFIEPKGAVWKDRFSKQYPVGLYQTMWAIYRGSFDVASWVEFTHDHDSQWTPAMRQEGRVNAALEAARKWHALSKVTGRYAA